MANKLYEESAIQAIADSIRAINGSSDTYTVAEMAPAIIDAIPTETASGNPIHITDAAAYPAESVVTTLEPVQDLHGYDKPWPAGGGKNLLPPLPNYTYEVSGVTIKIQNSEVALSGTATNTVLYDVPLSVPFVAEEGEYLHLCNSTINNSVSFSFGGRGVNAFSKSTNTLEAIGPVATENIGITCTYLRIYVANGANADITVKPMIVKSSTAIPYEPYSNICPISGHTGVELTRTGKNQWDEQWELGRYSTSTGAKNPVDTSIRCANKISIKPLTEYYIKVGSETTSAIRVFFYNKNKEFINHLQNPISEGVITTPANAYYMTFHVSTQYGTAYNNDIAINYPATATTYEPYRGETHSITFPQAQSPVYGCEVDWTNGMLRVTKVNIASYNGETLPSVWISDRDVYIEGTTPSIGAQVVYELATPLEISLTPEVITLLKGENNIWTDSGTSEIEYTVDLQTYIQKLINEASTSASVLSVSPLSLGRSTAVSTDGESEEAEKLPVDEVESVDEADEVEGEPVEEDAELPVEEDTEAEPIESEIWVKDPDAEEVIYKPIDVTEPDTLEKEGGDTV